jgi:hypothetical protein
MSHGAGFGSMAQDDDTRRAAIDARLSAIIVPT